VDSIMLRLTLLGILLYLEAFNNSKQWGQKVEGEERLRIRDHFIKSYSSVSSFLCLRKTN